MGGVRHVVMLKFKTGTDEKAAAAGITEGLATLPGKIPQIMSYVFGPDLGLSEGNYDYVITADFADSEAYKAYATHVEHVAVVTNVIKPHIAPGGRVAVQLAIPDSKL
mmetsp:Transcript_37464/g.87603  ORF Transcript_37464/g.87603 Transcript_37464/m.87603 type:complete len:108 (-) Transcript_37464:344-667(-)